MFEIEGQYSKAKIFTNEVEDTAMSQIYALLNSPVSEGAKISIMSDVHAGAGCVIGYTSTLNANKVIPQLIGVDIGCGVSAWKLGKRSVVGEKFDKLDEAIRKLIPNGFHVRSDIFDTKKISGSWDKTITDVVDICNKTNQATQRVLCSIGSLGSGNHFCEIDKDDDDFLWLVIHSGSRNFGLKVANWHQQIAYKDRGGKFGGLAHLEGEHARDYMDDMAVAQKYAALNRMVMGYEILTRFYKLTPKNLDFIESVHNYINFEDNIIRKGAISAHEGEKVIIPLNMADGVIIGIGRGNEDWNCSAPHGLGRKMSRRGAKENIALEDFQRTMKKAGVWSSCVSKNTLDESPQAYKKVSKVIEYLIDTVDIICHMKPVYNFKASG